MARKAFQWDIPELVVNYTRDSDKQLQQNPLCSGQAILPSTNYHFTYHTLIVTIIHWATKLRKEVTHSLQKFSEGKTFVYLHSENKYPAMIVESRKQT